MTSLSDPQRRYDLDWIRVGAFMLLILYHVGMFYVPWDWHVKSPQPVEWLAPVMLATNPWRLTLLFLVSGAATRFMADKVTSGELARQRTWRLLPPLLLAVFVIVPPQSFYEVVEQAGFSGGFAAFYAKYVTASGDWCDADGCLITPTYNHMWFVVYLLVYTLLLAGLLALMRKPLDHLCALAGRLSGWRLIVGPIVYLALIRIVLLPMFGVTHALVDDWYNHALSLAAFLFGFAIAKSETLRSEAIRLRWPALIAAVCAYGLYAGMSWTYRGDGPEPPSALILAGQAIYAVDQWCAILAVLGFGARHLNRNHPVLTYLTLGVFPFYIVHQTIIVVFAHHLAKVGLPQGLEALLVIAVTFAGCFATYEIVRRVDWLKPWFGLKAEPRLRAAAQAA